VRGVVIGLLALPVLAIAVLSIRPGGLRQQLRNVRRRFKIAMVLAGVYLAAYTVARIAFGTDTRADDALLALLAVEALIFVILAQDPRPARP
jgi:hypothetical protein